MHLIDFIEDTDNAYLDEDSRRSIKRDSWMCEVTISSFKHTALLIYSFLLQSVYY